MSEEHLPIETLISKRCEDLSLTSADLVRRCGYGRNVSKGLRRLSDLCDGEFKKTRILLNGLAEALRVSQETIDTAVDQSRQQISEEREAAWRASFVPHAVLVTERRIPHPIFVAAVIGVERLLRIDFAPDVDPKEYLQTALQGVQQKLAQWKGLKTGAVPAFGRVTGVIVNYTPDDAARYDLDGCLIERFDRAYQLGWASFSLK